MKKPYVIYILLVLLIGCNSNSKKQKELRNLQVRDSLKAVYQNDSIQKAKLEHEQRMIQDSIIKKEEKIAISDINFGITRSEYKIKEKVFLKSLLNKEYNHYQIGNFRFDLFSCFTENNSLYSLYFEGERKYSYYLNVQDDYQSLISVLRAKYSVPNIHNGLPNWNEKNHELVWEHEQSDYKKPCGFKAIRYRYYDCDIWEIGKKRIELRLYFEGKYEYYKNDNHDIIPNSFKYDWKQLVLVIYQKDTQEKLEKEKLDNYEKELNDRKMREKEELDKAIKIL
jgi:hypothetical protein